MTKFVRVELENGALATVSDLVANGAGLKPLNPKKYPAVDKHGRPLPPEFPEATVEDDPDEGESGNGDKPADNNQPAGS